MRVCLSMSLLIAAPFAQIAIEHEIERNQDFFTLVMGEFVFSLLSGNPAGTGFHAAAGKAILSLVIAYCFRTIYVNGGGSRQITHPLRHVSTPHILHLVSREADSAYPCPHNSLPRERCSTYA